MTPASQLGAQTKAAMEGLIAAVAEGDSERLTSFLSAMARFHRYSVGNVLLIMEQRPKATRVAGFRTWLSLGRHVRSGEKAIRIVAPVRRRRDEATDDDEQPVSFRPVHVFDIAQTEGEPLPELDVVGGDPGVYAERLEVFIAEQGIRLYQVQNLGGADGASFGGHIALRKGLVGAERFSVLVHETAHELLHRTGAEELTPAVKETEAEAVAFVVCHAIGLDPGQASADYIRLHQGDEKTLAASLERIQRTAAQITDALIEEPRRAAGQAESSAGTVATARV